MTRAQGKRRADPPPSPNRQAIPSTSNVRLEDQPHPSASLRRLLNDDEPAEGRRVPVARSPSMVTAVGFSPRSGLGLSPAGRPLSPAGSPLSPLPPSRSQSLHPTPAGSFQPTPVGSLARTPMGGGSAWSGILGSNASVFNASQGRLSVAPTLSGATLAGSPIPPFQGVTPTLRSGGEFSIPILAFSAYWHSLPARPYTC